MKIYKMNCDNLDECYAKKNDQLMISEFIAELMKDEMDEMMRNAGGGGGIEDMVNVESSDGLEKSPVLREPGATTRQRLLLVGKDNSDVSNTLMLSDLDTYELDKDELLEPQLTPLKYDQIETLDAGLTWSLKNKFQVSQIHLIVCVALNEVGSSSTSRIIIPSSLFRGKLSEVTMLNERNRDKEVVEGDNVNIEFNFNDIFYK